MKLSIFILILSFVICSCSITDEIIKGVFVSRPMVDQETADSTNHQYSLFRFYPDGIVINATVQLPDSIALQKLWFDQISLWFYKEHKSQFNNSGNYKLKNGQISITTSSIYTIDKIPDTVVVKYVGKYSLDSLILSSYSFTTKYSDTLTYRRLKTE